MKRKIRAGSENETSFLNVDLDIYSKSNLERLVEALGDGVFVNYVGREKGRYSAHLSRSSFGQSADALMGELAHLIKKLPRQVKRLWDSAASREFNVGIEAGKKPSSHVILITEKTIKLVAALKGGIAITTYPHMNLGSTRISSRLGDIQPRRRERA